MTTTDDKLRAHIRRAAPDVAAPDSLLDGLRAAARRRRHRRRTLAAGLTAAAAAAAVVLGVAITAGEEGPPQDVDVVAPAPDADEPAPPAPTPPPDARDWDGARFDFGRIERVHRQGAGWLVDFDRTQLHTEDGLQSGPDFTEEPVVVGNTDEPTVNENRRLRTYAFRPDAEALVVQNLADTCSDNEQPAAPQWRRLSLDELAADAELWSRYTQVAVTFDPKGLVMRIRLADGC